jgi:hypothetical protein
MNPIIAALAANPAVGVATQQLFKELTPLVQRGIRQLRPGFFAPVLAPGLLVSCFAAGVAVGWFTAPRKGAVMRRKVRESVEGWYKAASSGARAKGHEVIEWARSHEGDGSPVTH